MRNWKKSNRTEMTKRTVNGVTFLQGSDNVFRDLGFPEAEAVNLMARADLMITIEKTIKERGFTQKETAKILGVGQPRVSDLYNGKIDRFTVDMLMKWLAKLGKQVKITVKDVRVA